jgi:hypothetical protein
LHICDKYIKEILKIYHGLSKSGRKSLLDYAQYLEIKDTETKTYLQELETVFMSEREEA